MDVFAENKNDHLKDYGEDLRNLYKDRTNLKKRHDNFM